MGALSPTQTIIRFHVEGGFDQDIHSGILAGLKAGMFSECPVTDHEDQVGWVPFEEPFTETFEEAQVLYGTRYLFALRIDRKTIPAKVIEQFMARRIKEKKEAQGREFISKNEKAEIKEAVIEGLLQKTPYNPQIYQFAWDVDAKTGYLYSSQKRAIGTLLHLFLKSFNHKLFQMIPYIHAAREMDEENELKLRALAPMKVGG